MAINIEEYIYVQNQDTPLAQIVRDKQDLYDENYTNFLLYIQNNLLNIATADAYGLLCWGQYLSESRIYVVELEAGQTEWYGYTLAEIATFGTLNDDNSAVTIILDDDLYRRKLQMTAYLRTKTYDMFSVNEALLLAFEGGLVIDCTFIDTVGSNPAPAPMVCFFYIHSKTVPTIDFLGRAGRYLPVPSGVGINNIIWQEVLYDGLFDHSGVISYGSSLEEIQREEK